MLNTPNRGVTIEHNLQSGAIGQVHLAYKGKQMSTPPGIAYIEIECEVYEEAGVLMVHSVCPKCRHSIKIDGQNKRIEFDRKTKDLHVEAFECPWEMGGDDDHHEFGFGLCRMKLEYAGKFARDA